MELVFSGADVMCATGDPIYSTPYLLAQRAGQKVQMEFLHQNKLSDFPRLGQWSEKSSFPDVSLFMDGFLYVSSGPSKTMPDRRGRDGECENCFRNQGQVRKRVTSFVGN
uniref:Uncharacterized protein n=1 Tax=Cyprinodon variegatus TaxID=28743 RepID=A0A3Q2GHS8_CYPVA